MISNFDPYQGKEPNFAMSHETPPRRTVRVIVRRKSSNDQPLPAWDQGNLSKHFEKRMLIDRGCLDQMIDPGAGVQLRRGHYRERSEEAFKKAALIARYRPESSKGSGKDGAFMEPRCLFADRELMTSITSDDRKRFISCYHWHFDELACRGKPMDEAESGRQLLKLKRRLQDRLSWNKIKDLTFPAS